MTLLHILPLSLLYQSTAGRVALCSCAKFSGVSSIAKEGQVLVMLPDAVLRLFLLYQPCRFWRKVANSWRQQLLFISSDTSTTLSVSAFETATETRDSNCLVKSFLRKPSNMRIHLHSLHLLPCSKQVLLSEPPENKRGKGYRSFWLLFSEDDMPG